MNKRFSLFLAVPVVLALCAGGCLNISQAKFERSVAATATMDAPKPVRISTGNGSVRVTRSQSDKLEIKAESALQTAERRDAFSIKAEVVGDAFVIEPLWPEGKALSNERCSFEISLPAPAGLTIDTSNGAIEISGFSTDASVETSNGRVTVNGHTGSLSMKSSNGAIEAKELNGPVTAKTSNGRITIHFVEGATGPLTAKTSNGAIELDAPSTFAGVLTLSTSNGRVTVESSGGAKTDIKKTSGTVTFEPSGQGSSLSTSNGGITVKHAGKPK
ncbi:MAG: DUF4097 domain-containing protein [Tepidisphaera sp.]